MLYLLDKFTGKNVNKALCLHLESILDVDPANPERRAKLCKAFKDRLDKTRDNTSHLLTDANTDLQNFEKAGCTCLRDVTAAGLTEQATATS
jgi:hypothetical protein